MVVMERVSTNLTLFYKFFIPTFWTVFFGVFTIVALTVNIYTGDLISKAMFRIMTVTFFLSGLALLYFTLMRLKRVEMDEHFVYVTDYFKSFRYPYHNIEKIEESDFLFVHIVHIYLKTPGHFGKKITFAASKARYRHFWEMHPGLKPGEVWLWLLEVPAGGSAAIIG